MSRTHFSYREHGSGLADLILFDRHLPEVVCLGIARDRYRLTDLVEQDTDPSYLKGDPLVRNVRNGARLGRSALITTIIPAWAEANWAGGDEGGAWLE